MAGVERIRQGGRAVLDRARGIRSSPLGPVLALVVLALAVRLPLLGARVAHWDEARVGWWILQYRATGAWEYHPILHGPFLFHVGRWLFGVLGASDAVMRLPTAVVGGLLPAVALWYRDHLADREVVALGAVLAVAPLFVFYSRFMRNDLLVAAFSLAALGALLRARATGGRRYLLAAALLLGLAFSAKENAVLYLLSWVGAAGIVAAPRWWREGPPDRRRSLSTGWRALRSTWPTLVAAVATFLAVVVAMYAPRTAEPGSGFDDLAAEPGLLPDLVVVATVGSVRKVVDLWVLGEPGGRYPVLLVLLVAMLLLTAPSLVALAAYAGLRERRTDGNRWLVRFALAWAALGVVGYPAAVDLVGGWTVVHVAAPLTIPAAVGLAALVDRARSGSGRSARLAVAGLVVLSLHVGVGGGAAVYAAPDHRLNPYPQPAQPSGDVEPTFEAVAAIAAEHPGTDVAFVGSYYVAGVHRRLPVAWYVRAAGGRSVAVRSLDALPELPPVVVVPEGREKRARRILDGYVCIEYEERPWTTRGPGPGGEPALESWRAYETRAATQVYVDRAALRRYYGSTLSSQRCG